MKSNNNESIKAFLDNSLGNKESLYEIHIRDESFSNKNFTLKQNEIVKNNVISMLKKKYGEVLKNYIDYHILDDYNYDVIDNNYAILDNGIDNLMLIKLNQDRVITLESGDMKDIMKSFAENLLEDQKILYKKNINSKNS